jgi:predicted nucleotidyltransferase
MLPLILKRNCVKEQSFVTLKKVCMTTREHILFTLKSNKNRLKKFGIRNVGLFGSYGRNEQSDKSDIDLLVDFEPEKENFDNLMAVYDIFEKIFKNEKVEVVTMNGLSPYIGPSILKEVQYV